MKVCHMKVIIKRDEMSKKYKILICLIVVEFFCVSILKNRNISFDNLVINATGTIIFFLPILWLLFLVSKDTHFSKSKRIIAKCFFYFIIVSYIFGGVVNLIAQG